MTSWSIDRNGNAEINGQPVDAETYHLFTQLSQLRSPDVRKNTGTIIGYLLQHPVTGPLVWETLAYQGTAIDPQYAAQAALAHWAAREYGPNAILSTIAEQSPACQEAMLSALASAQTDTGRPDATRAAFQGALALHDRTLELRKNAGQSAQAWFDLWAALLRQGRLSSHHLESPGAALPEPAPGQHSDALRLLLSARQEDVLEGETQPWRWSTGLQIGLMQAMNGPLDRDAQLLAVRELVSSVHALALHSEYWKRLQRIVEAVEARGELEGVALATLRRSASQTYGQTGQDPWIMALAGPELNQGEAWSDAFLARLDEFPAASRARWAQLVAFTATATAGKPSAKWLRDAQKHVDAVGAEALRELLSTSLPLLSRARTYPLGQPDAARANHLDLMLDEFNVQRLKGLLWLAPLVADANLARVVAGVVTAALRKVPGVGPRAPKVANAAVYALSQMESDAALSALARLRTTVTFKGTLREVQKGLEVVAERLNTSPEDLLELGVPTLGMQDVGERLEALGDVEARLKVDGSGAKLTFSRGGKALKSVPAGVKKDFADEFKELKAAQKDAEGAVSALAQRLDSLMISGKTWRGDVWQERYLNHPLAGTVARRLIWRIDMVPAFWNEGEMRSVNNHTLEVHPDSDIQLWHPLSQPAGEVLAWRDWLETLNVRQPFKQAWREVYLLTDAERRTGTYSNRFAGHVLKQHQFHQLAALRGWRNRLRLMVDDSYPPAMRDLPEYGLRAEYWIEGVGDSYGNDTTESGTYLRVRTDQLRFYSIEAPEHYAHASGGGYEMWLANGAEPVHPLPMEHIPALVLSEIMRDVDLFVGVASVGNDPTWQDGGPEGRFRDYWHGYSFGELSETAKTRTEYLARLLPRLKIKDRLSIDGRFLKVRGDRRTYKIHLGSSNILMEPNDQYLCIIPDGQGSDSALNFDGDRVLSLILSKAFLLADDTRITDPVILNQLGR